MTYLSVLTTRGNEHTRWPVEDDALNFQNVKMNSGRQYCMIQSSQFPKVYASNVYANNVYANITYSSYLRLTLTKYLAFLIITLKKFLKPSLMLKKWTWRREYKHTEL